MPMTQKGRCRLFVKFWQDVGWILVESLQDPPGTLVGFLRGPHRGSPSGIWAKVGKNMFTTKTAIFLAKQCFLLRFFSKVFPKSRKNFCKVPTKTSQGSSKDPGGACKDPTSILQDVNTNATRNKERTACPPHMSFPCKLFRGIAGFLLLL